LEEHTVFIIRVKKKSKNETSSAHYLLHTVFLLVLLFNPEDGGDMFHQNVGGFSPDNMVLYPRIQHSSTYQIRVLLVRTANIYNYISTTEHDLLKKKKNPKPNQTKPNQTKPNKQKNHMHRPLLMALKIPKTFKGIQIY
jgi:hypothetical protein